jgi:hypothetical protein
MKKLTNTYFIAFVLFMVSCSKDPINTIPPPPPALPIPAPQSPPDVTAISISGANAELRLHVHSSIPFSDLHEISITGILDEEFSTQYGQSKLWKLESLAPGTYRVTVRLGMASQYPNIYYYLAINFEITDANGIHRVNPTQLGYAAFAFDLRVVN